MMHKVFKGLMVLLLLSSPGVWAGEVALVTVLRGEVEIEIGIGIENGSGSGAKAPLQAFIKLHGGDTLQLGDAARLQIVYFQSARQETWLGPGNIEIGASGSKAISGIAQPQTQPQPQTQQLPLPLAKQLSKTPTIDSRGKIAALRTRAITPSLEQAQRTYQEMRAKADANDRNPELYLLSAYFELKEYERVRDLLTQLDGSYPGDLEIRVLKSLYAKAINNAKMAVK